MRFALLLRLKSEYHGARALARLQAWPRLLCSAGQGVRDGHGVQQGRGQPIDAWPIMPPLPRCL
jgi:hypothetical protein